MMKRIIIIAIAALFSFGQGAWAQDPIVGLTYNEEGRYYEISRAAALKALAKYVNDGNNCEGKTFKMTDNITFGEEDTFTPIGYGTEGDDAKAFKGIFDGDDKTISGITVDLPTQWGVGLFGYIYNATIKNIKLANCTFIGNGCVGGIVGNNGGSTPDDMPEVGIYNCHIGDYVTITATNNNDGGLNVGGIIGSNYYITVANCTSAATVKGEQCVGGIAGILVGGDQGGVIDNCYYFGDNDNIIGEESGLVVGARGQYDDSDNIYDIGIVNITFSNGDNETIKNEKRIENYNGQTVQVTLKDRTLYKDGAWNTICLPFDIKTSVENPFEGTPFAGAAVKKFSGSSLVENSNGEQTGGEETGDENAKTLKLNFEENNATSIEAGVPYMVKWEKSTNVSDPVFENVEIKKAEETESATTQESSVDFVGSFSPVTLTANDHSVLYMGADNKLYYPSTDVTIGSFRAYFKLNGITVEPKTDPAPENSINNFVLNFGDDMTGISLINHRSSVTSDSWFTLDGRKLSGQPTAKGIYINHGHKVIIK